MCELGSVEFDKMEVNTDLALAYFKRKNNVFQSVTYLPTQYQSESSDGHNAIHIRTWKDNAISDYINFKESSDEKGIELYDKMQQLAKLVEENAELFGQIEYTIRKIPIEEVKNYDIKLIVQNLLCTSYLTVDRYLIRKAINGIVMKTDSPLASVGFVAQLLPSQDKVIIFATKETAAVSYLFFELCQKVGLDSVEVIFIANYRHPSECCDMTAVPTIINGCAGVITERSDLDSAVDVLLKTTTNYPWKVTRIYVQESIYDRYKKVMEWKSGLGAQKVDQSNSIKRLCDNVYVCDGKTFLLDYSGAPGSLDSGKILVEAYRTTKELIALVSKQNVLYMSLWSSDISEANEIAFKVPSSIVWVNSYGLFDGPPNSSQAIYKELFSNVSLHCLMAISQSELLVLQDNWSKETFENRRRFLLKCLSDQDQTDLGYDIKIALRGIRTDNDVLVKNGRICMSVSEPSNIVYIQSDVTVPALSLAKLLTTGVAVAYLSDKDEKDTTFDNLNTVPITKASTDSNNNIKVTFAPYASRTKVVCTNFGTIFAN